LKLPVKQTSHDFRDVVIDNNILYLTVGGVHQIFLAQPQDGKILNKWGTINSGSKPEEFNIPLGITIVHQHIYICDSYNHRIQVLNKTNGKFYHQIGSGKPSIEVGQFRNPSCIYNDFLEDIIYVGDAASVQLFRKNGVCIQRLGDGKSGPRIDQFNMIYAICIMDDRLFVSDDGNRRMNVFERLK